MSAASTRPSTASTASREREHLDVLVVGAGLSGIGAGAYLETRHPGRSFAILEAREAVGGTWDLFRYPGIRSDSDMQTLGYRFRPWPEQEAIADGPAILRYVNETAAEYGLERRIRFGHRVVGAAWSSEEARWTVEVERTTAADGNGDGGVETVRLSCGFIFSCGGYFRYDAGFTPELPGVERFAGELVHPQHWPEQLDHAGKRVVVIGSGATAVTLVPALAERAERVTMLQRSPSYVISIPAKDAIANALRRVLPDGLAYRITRRKNVWLQSAVYRLSRHRPRLVRRIIRAAQRRQLPADFDVDTHFRPDYDPWDQRLCAVPDGDLFGAIRAGRAEIATDRIESLTERGLRLASGTELEADIIVTATGLNLQAFGGIALEVDGRAIELSQTLAYKGMMLSGVPNFAFAVGYINASWTLKVDLACDYVCRLLEHMDAGGHDQVVPVADDPSLETRPLLDFAAGYVQRSVDSFPKQGSREPWLLGMDYAKDARRLRGPIADPELRFTSASGDEMAAAPG